jgi:hypothetical protein
LGAIVGYRSGSPVRAGTEETTPMDYDESYDDYDGDEDYDDDDDDE